MIKKPKKFFTVPTARQILDHTTKIDVKPLLSEICYAIINSQNGESIRIKGDLLNMHPKTYKKDGETLIISQHNSSNGSPLRPFELRKDAIQEWLEQESKQHDKDHIIPFSNFAYKKIDGSLTDKLSPLHIVKAAKIYSYAQWNLDHVPRIDVKAYDMRGEQFIQLLDSHERVSKSGAQLILFVPSRTQRSARYKMRFSSIPVIDDKNKYEIAYNISSTHICEEKLYGDIAFPRPKTNHTNCLLDSHEIAGTFAIIDYYMNPHLRNSNDKPNLVPLEMNLTGIPTESFARDLDTLLHRTTILRTYETKEKKLNDAEMNYLLSAILIFTGHDLNLYASPNKESGKKIKEYNWTSMEMYK
ncbi:MAG: hypothetical protein WC758_03765 [Candidatus Woesearchaeota archaeon]|jgi:hypothetical protein